MAVSYVRFVNSDIETINSVNFVPDPQLELQLGNYPNLRTSSLYGRTELQNTANWTTVSPTPLTKELPLIPAPGVACGINYSGGGTDFTTQIIIECYETDTATTTVQKVVTLNDTTKVTIPGTIYRIVNMYVDPSGPEPPFNGGVYVYDNTLVPVGGVPPDYFDYMRIGRYEQPNRANRRETAIYYSPPGTTTYVHNIQITSNNELIEKSVSFEVHLNESHTQHLTFYAGTGVETYNNPYIEIGPGITVHIKAEAPDTANFCPLSFSMDLILYTPPT